ncbi:MAG: dihydrofolate reductase [Lachnospiraceae bacterium]|nr:dihydrofolate reductase [Lachnospiraceae bacterium]
MKCILSADNNWAIGLKNSLLIRIPSDMKNFRQTTTGQTIIMGRKTLESFPQGQPLANRTNIVLTSNPDYKVTGAVIAASVEDALKKAKETGTEIYVIGGETVYRQFLPYCEEALVTRIRHSYEADAHFPNLDEDPDWELVEEGEEQTCFDIEFFFTRYVRKNAPLSF